MFQKDGSSTIGGKKDAPLRKSDRRRLRDRAADALFVGGGESPGRTNDERIARAEKLVDDAVVAPRGGDVLSRKLRLSGGEHATLFLRTPSGAPADAAADATAGDGGASSRDDAPKSYPIAWPYRRSAQPILLEYEDADRKVNLVPLLPLLAALPPPASSPPLGKSAENGESASGDERRYRIPNVVVHPEVSKYMCRGADLMKSGIRSFPPPWTLRQSKGLVTVSVIGNPQPLAIGVVENRLFREYCYPSSGNRGGGGREAGDLVGPGRKGVGVTVVNCYGDDLWKKGLHSKKSAKGGVANPLGGGTYDDGNFGNVGFVDGARVHPILDFEDSDDENDEKGEEEDEKDGKEDVDATSDIAQLNLSDQNKEQPDGNISQEDEEDTGPDHDDILRKAFYTSLLHLILSKTPLPMPVSTYYAKHLLAAVPSPGPRLDMKQTTHKKIGPFLKEMESNGVIKLGASKDKKDTCAFLADIVKNNPELIQFKREWKREIEAGGGDASTAGVDATAQKTKMAVVDLFIVPRHIADMLQLDRDAVAAANAKTDERRGTGFLTKAECRALIENYIEKEGLAEGKGRVAVNGPLCDALYKASKKEKQAGQRTEYPTSAKRKDVIDRWTERMERGHALVQMPGSRVLNLGRGPPRTVDIEVEFRQGNRRKFLTRLRGMEEYGIDGEALSRDVSHRFACSSSVEADPVGRPALRKGRVELVFQGHLSEELAALLTGDEGSTGHGGARGGEYGLPRGVIDVKLRKGVPARKKR